jgi:hypothetical protein
VVVSAAQLPTVEDVARITEVANPVIRNLQITECYSRLAAAMAQRTYPCANWCSFATWASKQAGATIRGEDMLEDLKRELGRDRDLLHPIASLWRSLLRQGLLQRNSQLGKAIADLRTPFDSIRLASDAVAEGNLRVFAEIGAAFAEYLASCPPDVAVDGVEFRGFIDGLRAGHPPDGQDYLKAAFGCYQAQGGIADRLQRAQLIVLANLQIGLHEQTRLQPQIVAAMESAVEGIQTGLGVTIREEVTLRVRDKVFQGHLTEVSRLVITQAMMVLTLPGGRLSLAENIARPFPANLAKLDNSDLVALVSTYGALPPTPQNHGATDWGVLEQRMRFISHLFRTYHEDDTLATPPFTDRQIAEIAAGQLPDGSL